MKNIKIVKARYIVDSNGYRHSKAVMCLDTGEVFTSAKECADVKQFPYNDFSTKLRNGKEAKDGKGNFNANTSAVSGSCRLSFVYFFTPGKQKGTDEICDSGAFGGDCAGSGVNVYGKDNCRKLLPDSRNPFDFM